MRSIWRTLDKKVATDIGLTCLAVFFIGLSYGAIATASGFPLWVPAAQSMLVLAGASEFLFIGIVAAGGSPFAAALAGLLVNSRHLPYGLALPPGVTGRRWAGLPVLLALAAVLLLVRAPATKASTGSDEEPAGARVRTAP